MRRTWKWLNQNSGAIQTIVLTVALIFAGVTLYYNAQTLEEGNRIAWRTFLDTKSWDFGKEELEHNIIHCVYFYNVPKVDSECTNTAYDGNNLSTLIDYADDWISHLQEIRDYSHDEDKGYFATWYKEDADDLSYDPTGVVSFVLSEYYGCNKRNQSGNCDVAAQIGICIRDDNFKKDRTKCFDNLMSKRAKFLSRIGNITQSTGGSK